MDLVSFLLLLAQQSESPLEPERAATARTVLEGQVLTSEGWPARGAVVVSDAGGTAVAGEDGSFRLEIELSAARSELRVTAVMGSGPCGTMGSTSLSVPRSGGVLPVGALVLASAGACQPEWLPTFGSAAGTSGGVESLAVLDDGSGPALFVGGAFWRAGSVIGNSIAKWDGARWSQLGNGFPGSDDGVYSADVSALAMFDAGTGPQLYAAGDLAADTNITIGVARWDGTSWQTLDVGGRVSALVVFDDGAGPALYAGGSFTTAGGVPANFIAKWDGATWSALGSGMDSSVSALIVFDDGSGPALYAGGGFRTAGGVPASRIAKWDGTAWSALSGMDSSVSALTVFDDGSGPALYAGGSFRKASGVLVNRIAKWNGTAWSALGSGMNSSVTALTAFDAGGGPALFAAGSFTSAGGLATNHVARWDGSGWTAVGDGTDWEADALAVFDDGSGPKLYLGGRFELAGGEEVSNLASWDGFAWAPIGVLPFGQDGPTRISDLAVFDHGGGPGLYAAGFFTGSGWGQDIARWDGSAWTRLGSGADSYIDALAVFDDGGGPALYVGGEFTSIGGVSSSIARWDGSAWAPLGSGVNGPVVALAVFDDGSGDALYAGGAFTTAGGLAASRIARWDGASWSPLAGGTEMAVLDLVVFDDGGGDALYAGGTSTSASALGRIARWDGGSWSALGTGIGVGNESYVLALEVLDDGSGPALYAGGHFPTAGGAPVSNLARWDGTTWSDVGGGVDGFPGPPIAYETTVDALQTFDDGSGPALYAGGNFTSAGGLPIAYVARWDGASWAPLGSGTTHPVLTLAVHTGSTGNLALYAGGRFWGALDSGDSYLARWQGCLDVTAPTIHAPDRVVREVPGSPPGEVVTFAVTATDNKDASPSVTCTPPSGSFFPPGATFVTCQATDAAGNLASASFEVIVIGKVAQRHP